MEFIKRHEGHEQTNTHNSHYANLPYGNRVFYSMLVYLLCVLAINKAYFNSSFSNRLNRYYKFKKIVREIAKFNPFVHIVIIGMIALIQGFFDFEITKMSVYFKKMARLSYVLTITNLFLVIPRSNFFIFMSYLDSMKLHVWLSTAILILAVAHSVLFIAKWTVKGVLLSKIFKFQNFIGLVIFVEILVLLILSLTSYRRRNYQNFFAIHQIAMLSFVVLTIIHSDPQIITPFGFINITFLLIMLVNKIINNISKAEDPLTIQEVKQYGKLKMITFKNTKVNSMIDYFLSDDVFATKIIPGSHIRLHESSIYSWEFWLTPSHPFTLVNNKQLIIKDNEFSRFTSFSMSKQKELSLVGVHYPSQEVHNLINSLSSSGKKNVVTLVAGGSGISFVLSILTYILKLNTDDKIYVYWSVKDVKEVMLFSDFLNDFDLENIHLDLTVRINVSQFEETPENEQAKMESESALLNISSKCNIDIGAEYQKRLQMISVVENYKTPSTTQYNGDISCWNVCCGPKTMIDECRESIYAYNESISLDSAVTLVEFISEEYMF